MERKKKRKGERRRRKEGESERASERDFAKHGHNILKINAEKFQNFFSAYVSILK